MKTLRTIAIALCLTLAATAAVAAPAAVNLLSQVEVSGDEVMLLDLVAHPDRLDDNTRARLEQIKVMRAPYRGQQRILTADRLRLIIHGARLGGQISVLIPPRVEISRASQRLTALDLAELYRQAVLDRLGPQASRADVRGIDAGRDVVLPDGELVTRVRFPSSELLGRTPAMVDIYVAGRKIRSQRVVGNIDVYGQVVVAKRMLGRRQIIEPDDVEVVELSMARAPRGAVSDPERVIGLRTRTLVAMGEPLDVTSLDKAPLIRRGDVVTMVLEAPGVRITAKGKAEQTGYRGSRIRLINLASKREVYGEVTDSGTVEVQF